MATSLMESSSLPKPTRKATAPTPPAMQQPFPHQPQAQFPYSNQYYYPNYPQQPYPQGYFGQAPDQQQQQFAQWAFQQMMFNSAQQQQLSAMPGVPDFGRQRTGSGAGQEFGGFPPMLPPHLGFQPSGTPPPHPHPHASGHAIHQMQYASVGRAAGTDHQGFHPYRRPGQAATMPPQRSPTGSAGEFGHFQGPYPQAPQGYPQPSRPYAREMNGSATSLHSNGSGSERRRTGSNAGNNTPRPNGTNQRHGRNQSAGSSITAASARPESDRSVTPPARNTTASPVSSSGASPTTGTAPALPNGRTSSGSAASTPTGSTMRPAKPSPLSQQSFAGAADASKRLSRDDTTLEAPHLGLPKTSGLKGRLRRALSFSAVSTLDDAEEGKEKLGSRRKAIEKANKANAALQKQQHGEQVDSPGAAESIRTTTSKKPSRTASLFNRRLNASTDNISLQSTVSSASVMIRKLGSMGKLARRNSLAGLTGLFKDKKDKGHKAEVSEASVTHATVEVERIGAGSGTVDDMTGLSPAAKLARQHTLRSNAQAAERARLEAQQAAAAAQAAQINRVEEEEEEEEESDDETFEHMQMGGGFDDEDITVRLERTKIAEHDEDEVWAVGIRRSVERTRQPVKGILRNAVNFNQENYLDKENAPSFRQRANSETNPSTQTGPTPLARIPSPDPDHIDGLHRSGSPHETTISTFSAEFGEFTTPSLGLSDKVSSDKGSFNYTHPALNSSAPVLSSIGNTPLTQRSATAPLRARKLTFAQNLSVYDTFAPSTYDRRSEPATCNRLTPALAQRIKEELNSYKMEEMEVHANSRIHTHFFV